MGAMLLREGHRGHGPLLRVNPGLCSWPTPYCIRPGANALGREVKEEAMAAGRRRGRRAQGHWHPRATQDGQRKGRAILNA